jgi:hypothetical protein
MLRILSVAAGMETIGTRVYPERNHRKRVILLCVSVTLLAVAAGCGGGGSTEQRAGARLITGKGFEFSAPSDWAPALTATAAVVKRDAVTLVSVTVLPLVKPYRPQLFPRVVGELDRVAGELAGRLQGRVTERRTVIVAGRRVRQYQITHGEFADRLTFVLRDKQEFLLTCRWRKRDGEPAACLQLASSFRLR